MISLHMPQYWESGNIFNKWFSNLTNALHYIYFLFVEDQQSRRLRFCVIKL